MCLKVSNGIHPPAGHLSKHFGMSLACACVCVLARTLSVSLSSSHRRARTNKISLVLSSVREHCLPTQYRGIISVQRNVSHSHCSCHQNGEVSQSLLPIFLEIHLAHRTHACTHTYATMYICMYIEPIPYIEENKFVVFWIHRGCLCREKVKMNGVTKGIRAVEHGNVHFSQAMACLSYCNGRNMSNHI